MISHRPVLTLCLLLAASSVLSARDDGKSPVSSRKPPSQRIASKAPPAFSPLVPIPEHTATPAAAFSPKLADDSVAEKAIHNTLRPMAMKIPVVAEPIQVPAELECQTAPVAPAVPAPAAPDAEVRTRIVGGVSPGSITPPPGAMVSGHEALAPSPTPVEPPAPAVASASVRIVTTPVAELPPK